jgi:transcriptional regulator with XRE-family HTH domain
VEDDSEQIAPDDDAPELTEQRFAANLRAIREERGMSQGRLADEMAARGWPWRQQTVTRVETGRRMVRLGEAKAVAEILETSLDMLTMPTDEARVIEHLADSIRRVKVPYRLIAGATDELLRAREVLRTHPVVAAADPAESSRVLELVAEARDVQQLTPEGAVAQGIALGGDVTEFAKGADLTTFRPRSIADAGAIADALRIGKDIEVDLTQMQTADAQRITDFLDGATRVRGGMVERLGDMKYRAMPAMPNQREWAISATRGTLADLAPRMVPPEGNGA